MSIEAENIFVTVGARIRKGDFQQALASLEMFKRTVGSISSTIRGQFAKAFAGIDALGEHTDEIQHMGEVLGVSNNQVRAFSAVAKAADVDVAMFAKSMAHMSMAAAKYGSKDGKAQTAAFNKLGISANDLNGELREQPKLLAAIARRTAGMSAGAKLNVLGDIFGAKGALAIIPALSMGGKAIEDLMEGATKRTKEFDDAMTKLAETNKQFKKAFSENGKLFGAFVGTSGEAGFAVNHLRTAFMNLMHSEGVVRLFENLGRIFSTLVNAVGGVVDKLAQLSANNPGLAQMAISAAGIYASFKGIQALGSLYGAGKGLIRGLSGEGTGGLGRGLIQGVGQGGAAAVISGSAARAAAYSAAQKAADSSTQRIIARQIEKRLVETYGVQLNALNWTDPALRKALEQTAKTSKDAVAGLTAAKAAIRGAAASAMLPEVAPAVGGFKAVVSQLGLVGGAAAAVAAQMWVLHELMDWLSDITGLKAAAAKSPTLQGIRSSKWAPDNIMAAIFGTQGTAEYEALPDVTRARQAKEDVKAAEERKEQIAQANAALTAYQSGMVPSSLQRGGGLQQIALPAGGNQTFNITVNAAPGMSTEELVKEMRDQIEAAKAGGAKALADPMAALRAELQASTNAHGTSYEE